MNKTVLIVEDEIVLQDVYKLILSSQGYGVHTANNGIEGIKQLKAHKPDVVLLDMFMPVMDGREMLRNVDTKEYPKTKFIVFTNLSGGDTEAEMLELGAQRFVLKSNMAPHDLVAMVAELTA